MRIVFSRKGFDTGSGGTASPIIGGKPISLPIPTSRQSITTYDHLGLGEIVERVTRDRIPRDHLCHEDPMFTDGQCLFGQCGAAQSHLRNQGVGTGDVFLFFGLFSDERTGERHHRIFAYLQVDGQVAESIDVGDYERRYSCKRRGGRAEAIYQEQPSGGFDRLRPDYHPGPDEFRKDANSPVLLFDPEVTWYFGKEPQLMPEHLMHLAAGGSGHRVNGMREGDATALRSWLIGVAPPSIHHSPRDGAPKKPRRC